jgi:hypothetical protein
MQISTILSIQPLSFIKDCIRNSLQQLSLLLLSCLSWPMPIQVKWSQFWLSTKLNAIRQSSANARYADCDGAIRAFEAWWQAGWLVSTHKKHRMSWILCGNHTVNIPAYTILQNVEALSWPPYTAFYIFGPIDRWPSSSTWHWYYGCDNLDNNGEHFGWHL